MHDFVSKLLDTVFPPHEDTLRVRTLTPSDMKNLYTVRMVDDTCTLSEYGSKNIRALIHEAKFHGNTKAFVLLSTLINMYFESHRRPIDVIVPIPLSPARLRMRGYNQVTEILRAGDARIFEKINDRVLIRIKNTQPQTELAREQRLKNTVGAFSVVKPEIITGKHVLLIDDVTTTGSTLRTAKATLLPFSPASVTCVAFAH